MTVRCAICGEELLGAVNRCWKCGQQFAARPTVEGLPPVRADLPGAGSEPLEAKVLDDAAVAVLDQPGAYPAAEPAIFSYPPHPLATPLPTPLPLPSLHRPVKHPPNIAALGGAYGAVLLGLFGLALAPFRFEAAIVALVGLFAGLWGIYSPRRNWALIGMLLCALAIGLGTFTGVRQLYVYLNRNAPIVAEEPLEEEPLP